MPTILPYGEWKSPISSSLATEACVKFTAICVDETKKGSVYWCETRFDESGRSLVCYANTEIKENISLTPKEFNVRTTVHEYGNGAFNVHDGVVYFSNFEDQLLYMQKENSAPTCLTTTKGHRYANGFVSCKQMLYIVREDHTVAPKEAVNSLVVINLTTKEEKILRSGCDFYSSPKVSSNGKHIVWIQWCHPNMPWDSTELMIGDLNDNGDALIEESVRVLVGDGSISVMQPQWLSDKEVLYISDQSDYWNLYLCDVSTNQHKHLMPRQQELGLPAWWFAQDAYAVDRVNRRVITTFAPELGVYDLSTDTYRVIDTGYMGHEFVKYSEDGYIYCIGASTNRFRALLRVAADGSKIEKIKEQKVLDIDTGYFSIPEEIKWPTTDGEYSYGNLYMPQNKDYEAPQGTLPPLLVKVHGGPSAQCDPCFNLEIQYWTSRGYAILDANYRGSTGYGKKYRNTLKKNWGIVDIDDCCNGAKYLSDEGKVNSSQLCIDGGSAGGYTTLACLAFKNVFKAGASHYGVADIELLTKETHKFESQYMNTIVADYNEENLHIYKERSPIHSIEKFDCPIAFFQGDEDKIVPPNQAELMYEEIKKKGIPCTLVMFKGEQHGFRDANNIQKALDGQYYFFARVFGMKNPDVKHTVDIENMD